MPNFSLVEAFFRKKYYYKIEKKKKKLGNWKLEQRFGRNNGRKLFRQLILFWKYRHWGRISLKKPIMKLISREFAVVI